MKKIFLSLFICLPFAINAQDSSTQTFTYTSISTVENGTNSQFHEFYTNGIKYYNQGVEIMKNVQPNKNDDATKKSIIQANANFKMALRYLTDAYNIDPKNENILKALQGTYYAFKDMKNSDRYKNELESLKK